MNEYQLAICNKAKSILKSRIQDGSAMCTTISVEIKRYSYRLDDWRIISKTDRTVVTVTKTNFSKGLTVASFNLKDKTFDNFELIEDFVFTEVQHVAEKRAKSKVTELTFKVKSKLKDLRYGIDY